MASEQTTDINGTLSQYSTYELNLARGLMMTRAGATQVSPQALKPTSRAFTAAAKPKTEEEIQREMRTQALKDADYHGGYTARGALKSHELTAAEFRDYADGKKSLPEDAAALYEKRVAERKKQKAVAQVETIIDGGQTASASYMLVNDTVAKGRTVTRETDGRTIETLADNRTITHFASGAMVLRGADGAVQRVARPGQNEFGADTIVTKSGPDLGGTVRYDSPNGMRVKDYTTQSATGWSSVADMKDPNGGQDGQLIGSEIRKWGKQAAPQAAAAAPQVKTEIKTVAKAPWHDPRQDDLDAAVERLIKSAEALRRPEVAARLTHTVSDTGPAQPQALQGKLVGLTEDEKTKMLLGLNKQLDERLKEFEDLGVMQKKRLPTPVPMPTITAPQRGLKPNEV